MKMLLCSIGSNRHETTTSFGIAVAKALSADTMLLGVPSKKKRSEELEQALEQVALQLAASGLPVQVRVEAGSAEDIVMNELGRATYDLVALGALGSQISRKAFFNTVGMRIIEQARNSVLVIKGDRASLSRVLICASGTEHGHLPVWAGASLACGAGAQATVLHVVDAMPAMYAGLEQMEETLAELLQSESERSRELKWAAQVVKAECDISEIKLRRGIVVDELMHEAAAGDYDVIVLGSSRRSGGLVRMLMGDLTREVVTRANRPVLVVRPMD